MKCPGCKRDKDAISSLFRQCEQCGYVFKTIEETHVTNKVTTRQDKPGSLDQDHSLINKIFHKEQLGHLNIGDRVKIDIPEGVWHGASGIIIDKIHKYYKVQIMTGTRKTSTVVNVLHNQVRIQ